MAAWSSSPCGCLPPASFPRHQESSTEP
jgi:hypothetical protein